MKNILSILFLLLALSSFSQQWEEVINYPKTQFDNPKIAVANEDTIVIANDSGLFISNNNGNTWTLIKTIVNETKWLNGKVGIASNGSNSELFLTEDGGGTWSSIVNTYTSEFGFTNDSMIYYLGYTTAGENFIKSINRGTTWDSLLIPSGYSIENLAYSHGDSLVLLADSSYIYKLIRTRDNGANWDINIIGNGRYKTKAKAKDYNSVLIFDGGDILKTLNGGDTFQNIAISSTSFLYGLSVHNNLVAFSCSTSTSTSGNRIIARSTDFLTTWSFDTIKNYSNLSGVSQVDLITQNYGWAAGLEGIFKYDPLSVSLDENLMTQHLFKCYPNPFKNNTRLTINTTDYTDLAIYSINGQLIKSMNITSLKSIQLGEELNSGIYFITLKNNKQSESLKVVKL